MLTTLLPAKVRREFAGARLGHAGWLRPAWPVFAVTLGREANTPSRSSLACVLIGRMGNFCAALLDSDLDLVAFDFYAVETDFTVGLQSIESGFRIRFCAG